MGKILDVPSPVVIRAILRVAIFSIEVPEAKSIMRLRQQPRARNALSFGTEMLKRAKPEESRELTTGGGFHFTFLFIYWTGLLFHLIETFFLNLFMATLFLLLFVRFISNIYAFVYPFFEIRL